MVLLVKVILKIRLCWKLRVILSHWVHVLSIKILRLANIRMHQLRITLIIWKHSLVFKIGLVWWWIVVIIALVSVVIYIGLSIRIIVPIISNYHLVLVVRAIFWSMTIHQSVLTVHMFKLATINRAIEIITREIPIIRKVVRIIGLTFTPIVVYLIGILSPRMLKCIWKLVWTISKITIWNCLLIHAPLSILFRIDWVFLLISRFYFILYESHSFNLWEY